MTDFDRTVARRTLLTMLGIMGCYAWALTAMLHGAAPGWEGRLLGFHPGAAPAWALGALITVAYVRFSMSRLPLIRERVFDVTALKLVAIPFSLAAGFVEELMFRRDLMDALARAGLAWPGQLVLSALAFGGLHAVWGVFGGSWRATLRPMLFTGVLGAAYAALFLLDGRDVAPCIWSHVAIDLCIEPWLLMAVMRLRGHGAPKVSTVSA